MSRLLTIVLTLAFCLVPFGLISSESLDRVLLFLNFAGIIVLVRMLLCDVRSEEGALGGLGPLRRGEGSASGDAGRPPVCSDLRQGAEPPCEENVAFGLRKEAMGQQDIGRFHDRCSAAAKRYLLSSREAEVLTLLAKGHNAAFIQDELFISKSTAKTHISHIYRKMNVHSQQELLRMIDGSLEVHG